ncbi:hypothetical protein VOLCADRAFT_91626 [Volvox carteri f. nagariensis]|uniref:Uncharacterized protein n=1 Tax=Volvox carteri f. nagariensis TaxID=3068 RepID=D8TXK3_VOLCA|nr:uncharacterized protein VOLCADRAFT_91626 [Volvox carteri f. nagariensis]EFJ47656.1 hypothetical protein VOLCADRAFT_91626 [Volvox carteri f. nagariensis]|eukprot:XP_002951127.1 hypothetical protein VOLCADRAFT_91626 [Volvox carteri f. nagariensis]
MNPDGGQSWDNLTADLVERVVSFLDPNEVVCTVKEINKAMASQFREKVAIRLSQPVPHHAFNRHWSRPEAVHNFTRSKRQELLLLTARSGSLANLQVAVKTAGCELSCEVFYAATQGGNLEMCQWLQEEDCFHVSEEVAAAAARSGHLETRFELEYGSVSRVRKPWMPDVVTGAAYGFDLAALQDLHQTFLSYGGGSGNYASRLLTRTTLAEALVSPTPDWRAKVEWLQAQGCRLHGEQYFDSGALVSRPDAVERAQWLLVEVEGEEEDVVMDIFTCAVHFGNLPLIRYLRVGRDWLLGRTKEAVVTAASAGNKALLVELVTLGWRLDGWTAQAAVEGGHLHILKWMGAGVVRKRIQELAQQHRTLLKYATSCGSVEVMEWLLNEIDLPWSGEKFFNLAVAAGSPAVLEWLVARGVPMGDDGELYVTAAHHHDLVMLRCLRRLDCPWGPGVFSRAVYDRGSTVEVLQWLHAEGCPVDWEEARSRAKTRKNQYVRDANAVAVHAWIESIAPS